MALLQDSEGKRIYLSPNHVFGRLHGRVDSRFDRVEISRIHAVIEWRSQHWHIRDLSRNGSWLNHVKLKKDRPTQLTKGDLVQFGNADAQILRLQDDTPPLNVICQQNSNNVISLQKYNLLPDEFDPELVVYHTQNQWYLERIGHQHTNARLLNDREWILLNGARWQLKLADTEQQTNMLRPSLANMDELALTFKLSQDEESTSLQIETPHDSYQLNHRSHHYLSLNLARIRFQHTSNGLSLTEQGWVYADELANSLGLTENNLNILIHRARRQFSEFFSNDSDSTQFIQRRNGMVRLGCQTFKIYKGGSLECVSELGNCGKHARQG